MAEWNHTQICHKLGILHQSIVKISLVKRYREFAFLVPSWWRWRPASHYCLV
jgi:hypothetical protein